MIYNLHSIKKDTMLFIRFFSCCIIFIKFTILWTYVRLIFLNQSTLKEISPGISLEGMMLKLKLQYFGYLIDRVDYLINKSWLIGKDCDAGRGWGQEEKGMTEDEMAGWYHWLDGHESE